jgi:benzodiazapine receptor
MTTYIPSLTLPSVIFENAALSVLLPIAAGTAVGFSTQRKTSIHLSRAVASILTSS